MVLRCTESRLRIPAGQGIRVAPITSQYGNYELKILTRAEQANGIEIPLPRELWIEVTGPAPSLDIALGIAAGSANEFVRKVAFGANAWQGLLMVHLAYDNTPSHAQRQFVQNWVQDETGLPRVARIVDPDLMLRMLIGITQIIDKDTPRVARAIWQYTDALQHWKTGNELYALAHLYMGIEAITPTAIRCELQKRNLETTKKGKKKLEELVLGRTEKSLLFRIARYCYKRAGGYVPSRLDSWARQELIFCGDDDTYQTAKNASDGFEHGRMQHHEIHQLAVNSIEKTATYLRNAILKYIPISEQDRCLLQKTPYDKPLSTDGFDRQLLATINCDEDELAAPDQAYPIVRWEFNLEDYRLAEDGAQQMRVNQKITPLINKNAKMEKAKIHFRGPTETTHSDVEVKIDRRKPNTSDAGVGFMVDDFTMSKWPPALGEFILNCNTVRHLGLFWIQQLTDVKTARLNVNTFAETVEQIRDIISQQGVPEELRQRCELAWQEALQLDMLRVVLSGSAAHPEGLVSFEERSHGKAKPVSDIDKLAKLKEKTAKVANELRELLDDLLRLQVFPKRTGDE